MALSAAAVGYTVVGGLVLYSGVKGATLAHTVQDVLKGSLSLPDDEPVSFSFSSSSSSGSPGSAGSGSGTDAGSSSASAAANQALAKKIIEADSSYSGWDSGQNWTDLVSLWHQESEWSATADNPDSGAYGIAQALGHGTGGAPYPSSYKDANPPKYGGTSNPGEQIQWGLSYIKSTYGSPVMAWAHETANNWY